MRRCFFPSYSYELATSPTYRQYVWREPDGQVWHSTAHLHERPGGHVQRIMAWKKRTGAGAGAGAGAASTGAPQKRAMAKGQRLDRALTAAVNKRHGTLLPQATRAERDTMRFYEARGWTPRRCQVVITAPHIRVATAIDAVLEDHGTSSAPIVPPRMVVIDNKTGFVNYLTLANSYMTHGSPLADVPNHPLNQHFLQVLLELAMLRRYVGADGETPFGAYVVQTSDDNVVSYELPAWLRAREAAVWAYFEHFCTTYKGEKAPAKGAATKGAPKKATAKGAATKKSPPEGTQ
jgi:hypothetical protein